MFPYKRHSYVVPKSIIIAAATSLGPDCFGQTHTWLFGTREVKSHTPVTQEHDVDDNSSPPALDLAGTEWDGCRGNKQLRSQPGDNLPSRPFRIQPAGL